jgi:hypothetical protein
VAAAGRHASSDRHDGLMQKVEVFLHVAGLGLELYRV